jgi:hypothetical protein
MHALPLVARRLSTALHTLQALCQGGVALSIHDAFDGQSNRFGWSDEDRQLLGSRESRVHEIATEQHIVLHDYVG